MLFPSKSHHGLFRLVLLAAPLVWQVETGCALAADEVATSRQLGRIVSADLDEISGLAASRQNADVLWLHNDGDMQELFAVTTTGKLVARVRVPTTVVDVEDMAIGPGPQSGVDFIYLGDIGDNDEDRKDVRIVRFAEPILSQVNEAEIRVAGAEVLQFAYPDGSHNAEALLVDSATGDIYIATKAEERTRLYRAAAGNPRGNSPAVLELVANLKVEDISGGDISRSGDRVLLRKEDRGWLWRRQPGEDLTAALKRAPVGVRVRGRGQGSNGEAVGFSPDGVSYFTVSEGKQPMICVFPVPAPPAAEAVATDP